MKTRIGFVSNSSSSSFCIYGYELPVPRLRYSDSWSEVIRLYKTIQDKYPDIFNKFVNKITANEAGNRYDKKELLLLSKLNNLSYEDACKLFEDEYCEESLIEGLLEDLGLSIFNMMGEYEYVGRSWDTVRDDETGLQFKNSIESVIHNLFGADKKCVSIEEAWQDC
jgi:hypothetical protein